MSELLALGASHKTAPLAIRERLALPEGRADVVLGELLAEPSVREAVALFTCNRTELYLVVSDPVEAESAALSLLARQAGIRPTELVDAMFSYRNYQAAEHLFRVASGLDSMVIGEAEVQGQVKRAYERALGAGATGSMMNKLFRQALATGKRVRTQTRISEGHASMASVAVDLAEQALGDLTERRVLILGAGKMAEGTARALHEHGVQSLLVANRRPERARALAERFDGELASFDELAAEVIEADIVVSSTASERTILSAEQLDLTLQAREGRPLLLIDLAVPRDLDPSCGELDGVTLYDVDDLQSQVSGTHSVRRMEARRGEGIVEEEMQGFADWLGSLEVLSTVGALRAHGDAVVASVLADNAGRWESLTERDRARVEALARTVANRLLHVPTLRLKATDPGAHEPALRQVRELFGLEEPDTAAAVDDAPERTAQVRELRPR